MFSGPKTDFNLFLIPYLSKKKIIATLNMVLGLGVAPKIENE